MLQLRQAKKSYGERVLFEGLGFELAQGEHLAITGPSGAGKSTLLNCLTHMDVLDEGEILFDGQPLSGRSQAARFRLQNIGLVFQEIHLVESLTVWQNLDLLAQASGSGADCAALIEAFGLRELAENPVRFLSRGERQKVAVARALANRPKLLFADEPTSSLDPDCRAACLAQLWAWCEREETSVVMVSHDAQVLKSGLFSKTISLELLSV